MNEQLRKLALRDGRYSPEAFVFLFDALEPALRLAGKEQAEGTERHISGGELVDGLRELARETFGPLAPDVWRAWGVHSPLDWGRIVFLLVDEGLLRRQESDTLADFELELDFEREFVEGYRPRLPRASDPRGGPERGAPGGG